LAYFPRARKASKNVWHTFRGRGKLQKLFGRLSAGAESFKKRLAHFPRARKRSQIARIVFRIRGNFQKIFGNDV
jgi:hypothetical protein